MYRLPSTSTRLIYRTTRSRAHTTTPPTSIPTIPTRAQKHHKIHTTTPTLHSTPSLFNLSALSTSRETHALSKTSGLGILNHSTALQQLDAESRAHLPVDERGNRNDGVRSVEGKARSRKGGGVVVDEVVGGRRDGLESGGGRLGVGFSLKPRASRPPPPLPSIPNPDTAHQIPQQQQPNAPAPTPAPIPIQTSSTSPPPPSQALTTSLLDFKLSALQSEQDTKLLLLGERMLAANKSWFWFSSFAVVASLLGASILVISFSNLREIGGGALGLRKSGVVDRQRNGEAKKSKASKASKKKKSKSRLNGAKDSTVSRATTVRESPKPPSAVESIPSGLAWLWQAPAPTPTQRRGE